MIPPIGQSSRLLSTVLISAVFLATAGAATDPGTAEESSASDTSAAFGEWFAQLGWDVHYKSAREKTLAVLGADDSWVAERVTETVFATLHEDFYSGVLGEDVPNVLSALCIEQTGGCWSMPSAVWYVRTDEGSILLTDIHLPAVPGEREGEWSPAPCRRIDVPPRLAVAFEAIIDDPAAWRSNPEAVPFTGSVVYGVSLFKAGKSYQALNFGGGLAGIREAESIQEVFLAAVPGPRDRSKPRAVALETGQLARQVLLGPPLPSERPPHEWLAAFDETVRATLGWDNTFETACVNATVPDARYELSRQYMVKLASEWPQSSRYRLFAERMTRELGAARPKRVARLEWLGPWLDYNCVWILDGAEKDTLLAIGSSLEFGPLDDDLVARLRVADLDPEADEHPFLPGWVSLQLAVEIDGDATDGVFDTMKRHEVRSRFSYVCDMWMTGPLYVSWWEEGQEPVQFVVWDADQKGVMRMADRPPAFWTEPDPADIMYAWEADPVPDYITFCDHIPAADRTKACEIANAIRGLFRERVAVLADID